MEVTAPTKNETPESRPLFQAQTPSTGDLEPHAMRAAMHGKTTTTKRAHSLYSA